MALEKLNQVFDQVLVTASVALRQEETYAQIGIILAIYAVAFVLANRIRKHTPFLDASYEQDTVHPLRIFISKLGSLIFPLIAILMLRISVEISENALDQDWLVQTALTISILILFHSIIRDFISNSLVAGIFRWLGMPLLFLYLLGILANLIEILESISISIGNIEISAYGIARVAIFGTLLFWVGRVSNKAGRDIISRQKGLELRTREVAAKLLEITIFFVVFLLLLQIMGINLTALAVCRHRFRPAGDRFEFHLRNHNPAGPLGIPR
jgi:hypothetical protein